MDTLKTIIISVVLLAAVGVTCLVGWVTHIIWWVTLAMDEKLDTWSEIFLAAAGTLFPPIGVIHGFIILI
jgi:hypothetical protein